METSDYFTSILKVDYVVPQKESTVRIQSADIPNINCQVATISNLATSSVTVDSLVNTTATIERLTGPTINDYSLTRNITRANVGKMKWYDFNKITTIPHAEGDATDLFQIVFDGSYIWTWDSFRFALCKIDSKSGEFVERVPITGTKHIYYGNWTSMYFDGIYMWIGCRSWPGLFVFDLEGGHYEGGTPATIFRIKISTKELVGEYNLGDYPSGFCLDDDNNLYALWAGETDGSAKLTRFGPESNPYVSTYTLSEYAFGYSSKSGKTTINSNIFMDDKYILIVNRTGTIAKINGDTGEYTVSEVLGAEPTGFMMIDNYYWMSLPNGSLLKIDPSTLTTTATISVGGSLRGLCFDGQYIWVIDGSQYITQILPTGTIYRKQFIGVSLNYICFDGNSVWAGSGNKLARVSSFLSESLIKWNITNL